MTTPFDTAVTDRLLSTTRAVRKRLDLDRPVEPGVVLDCLRLAVQAPTGSNSQGWRWVVVTDADKRAKLAELYRAGGAAYMSAKAGSRGTDPQANRVLSSSEHLLKVIDRVPVLVIPCLRGRITDVSNAAGFYGSILPAPWRTRPAGTSARPSAARSRRSPTGTAGRTRTRQHRRHP